MEMPKLLKRVQKWGDSLVIRFNPEEVRNFQLSEGRRIIMEIQEVEIGEENGN